MKLLLALGLVALATASAYDPRNHHNGHELEVSLREDTNTIFVIMWYSSKAEEEVTTYNSRNKTAISSKLSGKDHVSWSMIDMSIDGHADPDNTDEDYSELFNTINGKSWDDEKEYIEKEGPIVNVIRKSKGVRISGKGIPDEVSDQVDELTA